MFRVAALVLAGILVLTFCGAAFARTELIIYTSMKESMMGSIVEAFERAHPDIRVDYTTAGAGALMTKIAAERQSGKIIADILWHSEVPDFYNMRDQGLLYQYKTPLIDEIMNPFDDWDGHFTAARLGTLGIIINTNLITEPPTQWADVLEPKYEGYFVIADPSLSGTAFMSVAMLTEQFGWEFIEQLGANDARIGRGSQQVIDDTANEEFAACLGVDYIVSDRIALGAPLALHYPPEVLMAPSPITIFKDSLNIEAAKIFVDFLLSREAQQIIASEHTLAVRLDVVYPEGTVLPPAHEALERAIKVDYLDLMGRRTEIIERFESILRGR
jgi:iron(III) transport system substrate-binding protein